MREEVALVAGLDRLRRPRASPTPAARPTAEPGPSVHPDSKPGDKVAEDRFKTIAEAYDVLGVHGQVGQVLRGVSGRRRHRPHLVRRRPAPWRAPECRCGKRGCVEAYVGGWAIARDLGAALGRPVDTVVDLLGVGDQTAVRLARDAGRILGASFATAVSLLNPAAVVLAAGQVLIEVVAVPVLHLDVQIRAGWERDLFGVQPPYMPGSGYVGRVCGLGVGVDSGWAGAMVAVQTGQTGGYVEYAVADPGALVDVPDGVGMTDAAALLHDGLTALGLLERVPFEAGDRVLVLGAAGGLESLLVQLAAARGGQVTAAARGEAKLEQARSLGASSVVDYTDADWTAQARAVADGRGFDVVFDGIGGELGTAAYDLVASGGRFSAHGAPSGSFAGIDREAAAGRDVTVTGIEAAQFEPDDGRLTRAVYEAAAAGTIRAVVGQTFALYEARAAHEAIEARQVSGKTVLLTAAATGDGGSR